MNKRRIKAAPVYRKQHKNQSIAFDYAGNIMLESKLGNHKSPYAPTIDHIIPKSKNGKRSSSNTVLCSRRTNQEKSNCYMEWSIGERRYCSKTDKNGEGAIYTLKDDGNLELVIKNIGS